ncbi:segregation/condensation protein A [Halohasta salina]|uniref:segregation/condensation protein A n=1 Tax=Halohasta salina TaxID=2961621 RepID=UPI0020A3595B|nr:ScpA family protein [Halohasta salina]
MTDAPEIAGVDGVGTDVSPPDEVDDDEVEPVELLVQLAKDGEIDPWDIDIVDVTDAFLSKLHETDLRTTARALFYASVLLRMKGDQLLSEPEPDDDPEPEPWEQAMADSEAAEPGFDPVDALEAEMDRRLERKNTRGSPETLDELVRELREAERDNWWKRRREYDTSDSPQGFSRGTQTVDYRSADDFRAEDEPTENDVTGTTHAEEIDDVIEDVLAVLQPQFDEGRAELLYREVRTAGGRPFMTYLALLFLSNRGRIRLQQDDLFGDLWIQDPEQVEAPDPASEPTSTDTDPASVDADPDADPKPTVD